MRLEALEWQNARTTDYASSRGTVSASEIVGGLRRDWPYFGLVEVAFPVGHATLACFNDDAVVLEAVWNGRLGHERFSVALWQELCRRSSYVVDVGAYTGIYAVAAVAANEACRVVAFEPVPHIYARLIANVALNAQGSRIRCINTCVTNTVGDVVMRVPIGPSMFTSGASVVEATGETDDRLTAVSGDTLDRLLEGLDSSRPIGAMKIDVEMHEAQVLEGGRELIGEDRPVLLVEVLRDSLVPEITSQLPDDYSLRYVLEEEARLTTDGAEFERSSSSMNALLVPNERLEEMGDVENVAQQMLRSAEPSETQLSTTTTSWTDRVRAGVARLPGGSNVVESARDMRRRLRR